MRAKVILYLLRRLGAVLVRRRGLIRRSGLFDPAFYGQQAGLDAPDWPAAWTHYRRVGIRAELSPHPLFDPAFCRDALGLKPGEDALAAYLRRGWRQGVWPNRLFDPAYYLAHNPDVRVEGAEPLSHYAARGWREGRATSRLFDPAAYRRAHPELAPDRDPLAAALLAGDAARAEDTIAEPAPIPTVPARPASAETAVVDVVVPVYRGRRETLTTLSRVLAAASRTPFELVAIDDATPEPALAADLDRLAGAGALTLLRQSENGGFVAAANRGLALHPGRDAVLLNADTEVFDGWLDRLRAAATGGPDIASATPWSNAATILSYPIRLRDNAMPLELDDAAFDALAAGLGLAPVEIPTAVGFCMYMRRAALAAVGPFDERAFGRGYGEENDWCRRAVRSGWRHVAALDVFVRHHGATSFGAEKAALVAAAVDEVERRHPGYRRLVDAFIMRDPLRTGRRRLDEARVRAVQPRSVLRIGHGEVQPVAGGRTIRLVPEIGSRERAFRFEPDLAPVTPNLPVLDLRLADPALAEMLRALDVGRLSVGAGAPERLTRRLPRIASLAGIGG